MRNNETAGDKRHEKKGYQDAETLRNLYHDEEMSLRGIGDHFDKSEATIRRWMDKCGIERRQKSEAATIHNSRKPAQFIPQQNGYAHWQTGVGEGRYVVKVHRLAAVAWFGFDAVCDNVVHHKNTHKRDNREVNLEVMSAGEHSRHHNTKLSQFDKIRMAELYQNGDSAQKELGEEFDVSGRTVAKAMKEIRDAKEQITGRR